jgi:hypothetical protein
MYIFFGFIDLLHFGQSDLRFVILLLPPFDTFLMCSCLTLCIVIEHLHMKHFPLHFNPKILVYRSLFTPRGMNLFILPFCLYISNSSFEPMWDVQRVNLSHYF